MIFHIKKFNDILIQFLNLIQTKLNQFYSNLCFYMQLKNQYFSSNSNFFFLMKF